MRLPREERVGGERSPKKALSSSPTLPAPALSSYSRTGDRQAATARAPSRAASGSAGIGCPITLVLYDNPRSSNALKARFCLAECGLAAELRTVPFDQPRPDWYLAVNPLGGIPTLDDGGFVLSESNAILRYLAVREGRNDLYPTEPRQRARVEMMLDRWSSTFRPAFFRHEAAALGFAAGKGMGGAPPDPDTAGRIATELGPTLALLDSIVDADGTALGSFSLADIAAAPILYRTRHTGLDLSGYPNLERWRDTVVSRPSFTAADPVV